MADNPTVPELRVLRDNRGLFYGWFVVAAAFAVTFAGFGCTYSFSAFFESLQHDFGASRGSVSLIFALAGFLYFSVGSISGPLADRFGSRRLALIGMNSDRGGPRRLCDGFKPLHVFSNCCFPILVFRELVEKRRQDMALISSCRGAILFNPSLGDL